MKVITNGHSQVTPERIFQFGFAYAPPLIIEAAVRHNIFDAIDAGNRTVTEIATEAKTSERGTRILLNALTGLQFLNKKDEKYTLAPDTAEFLVSDKKTFLGGFFKHTSSNLLPKWLRLAEVVQTGKPVLSLNDESVGTSWYENFVTDLFPVNYAAATSLAKTLELAGADRPVSVLDLAAGSGVWGIALAQASPKVRVTAVDWEGIIPLTSNMTEKFGLKNQFSFVADDLETADFGEGHDIAMLGHILHSEGEHRGRDLVRRTFRALVPGGTIAIAEWLVNSDRTEPVQSLIFAVNMLLLSRDGDVFSFDEIRSWLEEAGFEDVRLVDAPSMSPLILATKPQSK